jgi:anti-sigma regulatory factor (Ser/Thr protein kinase)
MPMATTTWAGTQLLIAFPLPNSPESAGIARCHVRAALNYHGLADYADDAQTITSELVTNAIQHATTDGAQKIGLALLRSGDSTSVAVVVTDPSSQPPVKRDPARGVERGRGLQIVEALSAHWGWHPEDEGKAVFAILTRKG